MSLRYALLAILRVGPLSGYELQKQFAQSVGHVWHAPDSQIYPELRKMEAAGLIEGEEQARGERGTRRVYHVTDAGDAAFAEWMASPLDYQRVRDPAHLRAAYLESAPPEAAREFLRARIPLFGICFGNQILGRALGLNTYKMVFGHRGINIPVIDHATGKVAVTAQNHGFALEGEAGQRFDTDFGPAVVSHTCANDGVVEGVKLADGRAFSVQYHPEAAAGPHDAEYLFDQFVDLMAGEK